MNRGSTFRRVLNRAGLGVIVSVILAAGGGCAPTARPCSLRTEYRVNPLGIDAMPPRLSWAIDDPRRGAIQTAWQVLVASTLENLNAERGDLWDSGRVASDQSHLVAYAGRPLVSQTRCYWKVRVWDADGKPSPWSEPAVWSMGLLDRADWKGKWIGRDEPPRADTGSEKEVRKAHWIWFPEGNPATAAPVGTRYFIRVVTLPSDRKVRKATCTVAADNSYALFINGAKAAAGYDFGRTNSFDVTQLLRAGENTIAVSATNAGESPNPAGLIGAILVEFEEGPPIVVATDRTWRTSDKELPDWKKPGFDPAGWIEAKELGAYGMAPWGEVKLAPVADRRLPARYLRHEFQVARRVKRATAYIAGLGYYELYLNGQKVGDHVLDPGLTNYDKRVLYATYDVTDRLRPAANAVGVILGNGRYYPPRDPDPKPAMTYGYPKMLLQMCIEYEDGSTAEVVSDETWKLTTDGPIRANNDYDGEEYDARMEMDGWCQPGFDDSRWQPAQVVQAPAGALAAQMAEPIRITKTLRPVRMSKLPSGVYIYDMGQNMVGWVRLTAKGPAGTRVTLRHAEVLAKDGSLSMENLRSAKCTDTYILKGKGTEVYEPRFTYHGFRFVELAGYPGEPTLSTIEGCVVHSDAERVGGFACSNEIINRVYSNVVWGIRGNLRSIPTDCPQRDERQGWLGDIPNEAKHESFEFNVANFYAKWLQDIEEAQDAQGCVPDVAPPYWVIYSGNVTWPSAYIIIPEWFHEQYADLRPLAAHYPSMCRWIEYMSGFLKDDLIARDQYGDWCVPPESPELIHSKDPARRTDPMLLATAYFYHDLCLMAKFAMWLDKPDDAKRFNELAARLKTAFNRKFYNEETGRYSNGTQTSSVLPLAFGLVPEGQRRRVFQNLVENIVVKCKDHLATGLIGGQWLMRVLSDNGRPDIAYRLAAQTSYPSWGYMAEHGATTIWELWNGDTADPAMNSHNHLMLVGDMAVWLYQYVAGIRCDPERPGFKHVLIRPVPVGDLKWAGAVHRSTYGTVASRWRRTEDGLTLDVRLPANTSAEVAVPTLGKPQVTITEGKTTILRNGIAADAAPGVKFVRMEKAAAVFDVGAGSYRFVLSGR